MSAARGTRRFVVLDRDGTIIVERGYLAEPDGVEAIVGAVPALRRLAGLGLGLVVVTNQSGVGRGLVDAAAAARVQGRLVRLLAASGVRLDGCYACPHHPDDGCACRKPRTALVERAARELGFDPRSGFVVGDKASDVELGRVLGATTILVRTGYGRATEASGACRPDHVADDLRAAAEIIGRLVGSSRLERVRARDSRARGARTERGRAAGSAPRGVSEA